MQTQRYLGVTISLKVHGKGKMKQTFQSDNQQTQNPGAEPVRAPRQQQSLAQGGHLSQLASMMNGSAKVRGLTQLKDELQHGRRQGSQNPTAAGPDANQVIQCLMSGESFLDDYQNEDATSDTIVNLLTAYQKAWGWGYGTFFGEKDGKAYRQERIQILADLERNIHEHFRDSGVQRISDAPNSKLMLELLDEVQAEHEKQIGELLAYKDELPVAERGLSKKDKTQVLQIWQSIVEGQGNLKIDETEKNKVTKLERKHEGFRVKALSSIARLLQGSKGRKLIGEANENVGDQTQHITIAPVSNKNYDVMEGSLWKQKKGTLLASGWDAEALKWSDASLADTDRYTTGTFWDLDSDDDPIGTYELASRHHQTKGKPDGVILGGKKHLFGEGGGGKVSYVTEHKDSENRVMTQSGKEGLSPTSVALGHELGHAVRYRRGASVPGQTNFLRLQGIQQEQWNLWSSTDEELVNIGSVENKLLKEKGLEPRIYHKDYEDSLQEQLYIRFTTYQKDPGYDNTNGGLIFQAIQGKKLDTADQLLGNVGF